MNTQNEILFSEYIRFVKNNVTNLQKKLKLLTDCFAINEVITLITEEDNITTVDLGECLRKLLVDSGPSFGIKRLVSDHNNHICESNIDISNEDNLIDIICSKLGYKDFDEIIKSSFAFYAPENAKRLIAKYPFQEALKDGIESPIDHITQIILEKNPTIDVSTSKRFFSLVQSARDVAANQEDTFFNDMINKIADVLSTKLSESKEPVEMFVAHCINMFEEVDGNMPLSLMFKMKNLSLDVLRDQEQWAEIDKTIFNDAEMSIIKFYLDNPQFIDAPEKYLYRLRQEKLDSVKMMLAAEKDFSDLVVELHESSKVWDYKYEFSNILCHFQNMSPDEKQELMEQYKIATAEVTLPVINNEQHQEKSDGVVNLGETTDAPSDVCDI